MTIRCASTSQKHIVSTFWSYVDERGPDECWSWTGYVRPNGYGRFMLAAGHAVYAHRMAYELDRTWPIPDGMVLDHTCRNRQCVNPAHLEVVTQAENLRRSPLTTSGRTTCPKGHPYDRQRGNRRWCSRCRAEWRRQHDH